MMIFAQLPTPIHGPGPLPISPDATSPTSWSKLFETVGFDRGLVIVLVVVALTLLILTGVLFYRISRWVLGPDGWAATVVKEVGEQWKSAGKKVEECLPKIQDALSAGGTKQSEQLKMCQDHTETVQTTIRHGMLGLKEMANQAECPEATRQFDLAIDALK